MNDSSYADLIVLEMERMEADEKMATNLQNASSPATLTADTPQDASTKATIIPAILMADNPPNFFAVSAMNRSEANMFHQPSRASQVPPLFQDAQLYQTPQLTSNESSLSPAVLTPNHLANQPNHSSQLFHHPPLLVNRFSTISNFHQANHTPFESQPSQSCHITPLATPFPDQHCPLPVSSHYFHANVEQFGPTRPRPENQLSPIPAPREKLLDNLSTNPLPLYKEPIFLPFVPSENEPNLEHLQTFLPSIENQPNPEYPTPLPTSSIPHSPLDNEPNLLDPQYLFDNPIVSFFIFKNGAISWPNNDIDKLLLAHSWLITQDYLVWIEFQMFNWQDQNETAVKQKWDFWKYNMGAGTILGPGGEVLFSPDG